MLLIIGITYVRNFVKQYEMILATEISISIIQVFN